MPPSAHTYPDSTADISTADVPYPAHPQINPRATVGRHRPLPSRPPLPSVREAEVLAISLHNQSEHLDSSFQTPPLIVQNKERLLHSSELFSPIPPTHTEPRASSSNRQSLPPPYTAVDPCPPSSPSSRVVHWADHPVYHSYGRRAPDPPFDATSHVNEADGHRASEGRICHDSDVSSMTDGQPSDGRFRLVLDASSDVNNITSVDDQASDGRVHPVMDASPEANHDRAITVGPVRRLLRKCRQWLSRSRNA